MSAAVICYSLAFGSAQAQPYRPTLFAALMSTAAVPVSQPGMQEASLNAGPPQAFQSEGKAKAEEPKLALRPSPYESAQTQPEVIQPPEITKDDQNPQADASATVGDGDEYVPAPVLVVLNDDSPSKAALSQSVESSIETEARPRKLSTKAQKAATVKADPVLAGEEVPAPVLIVRAEESSAEQTSVPATKNSAEEAVGISTVVKPFLLRGAPASADGPAVKGKILYLAGLPWKDEVQPAGREPKTIASPEEPTALRTVTEEEILAEAAPEAADTALVANRAHAQSARSEPSAPQRDNGPVTANASEIAAMLSASQEGALRVGATANAGASGMQYAFNEAGSLTSLAPSAGAMTDASPVPMTSSAMTAMPTPMQAPLHSRPPRSPLMPASPAMSAATNSAALLALPAQADPVPGGRPTAPFVPAVAIAPIAPALRPSEIMELPTARAPAPEALAEPPPEPLSPQSRAIVDGLPPEKRKQRATRQPVTIEHFSKTPLDKDEVRKHEGVGISISVRRPHVNVNHMLEEAYSALIAGNQEDAIAIYKEALLAEPSNKMALFGLATTYHRAGQLDLARPLYGKLLAIDPQNQEGLNNFLVLLADEAPEEALGEMRKLARNHPSFSPLPAQMAVIYVKMGDYQNAVFHMKHAIDLSPENIKYRYDMAIMLDQSGDWANAAEYYQQLITSNERGEKIPAKAEEIQERLTFIRSNKPRNR